MPEKEMCQDNINKKELHKQIIDNFESCVRSRDMNKLHCFMQEKCDIIGADALSIEFYKALEGYKAVINKAQPALEPEYTVIKEALKKIAFEYPTFYFNTLNEPPDYCVTVNEIFSNFISIDREILRLKPLELEDKIESYINLIQKCWGMYESQIKLFKFLLDKLENPSFTSYTVAEIKLSKKYKFIRHAGSHIRTLNLPDKEIMRLRNYNPAKNKIDWEEDIPYDKFDGILDDIYRFNTVMSVVIENVAKEVILKKAISRYQRPEQGGFP